MLKDLQQRHFWYRGRHRFLLHSLKRVLAGWEPQAPLRGVDLGGGCGGWVRYLGRHARNRFDELALADSFAEGAVAGRRSDRAGRAEIPSRPAAATMAPALGCCLPVGRAGAHSRRRRGPAADSRIASPRRIALRNGPRVDFFWSKNDSMVHHLRRYSRADFSRLARQSGFDVVLSRYFMFFLSPLLWSSRWRSPDLGRVTAREVYRRVRRAHRVPWSPINRGLGVSSSPRKRRWATGSPFPGARRCSRF